MYGLLPDEVEYYSYDLDIICTINNIQNPLNIKEGMVLKYPRLGDLENFRITEEENLNSKKKSILGRIGIPNKSTRTDKSRKQYQQNGYALPPTVNSSPRSSVQIGGGNFKIGGV
jgi:hypothetical protein